MKRVFALILAATMCFCLFTGCSGAKSDLPSSSSSAPGNEVKETKDATVYTLSFASTSPAGGSRNLEVEEVLKTKLLENSDGRVVLDIYSNSTLASAKEMFDALTNGIADIGQFLTPMYQGQFLYSDLFSVPGLYYGTIAETDNVIREYTKAFPDQVFQDTLKCCVRWSIGSMAIFSVKEVRSFEDIKGLTLRASSSGLPFYQACGAAGVSMSASDVYEGLKMGTINATVTGFSGSKNNKLAEVSDYAIPVPVNAGEDAICMSWKTYNGLPADIQAVIDDTFAEMAQVITEFTQHDEDSAIDFAKSINPNYTVGQFSDEDIQKMRDVGAVLMETKAAELDAKGLDGSGALEWLRSHSK